MGDEPGDDRHLAPQPLQPRRDAAEREWQRRGVAVLAVGHQAGLPGRECPRRHARGGQVCRDDGRRHAFAEAHDGVEGAGRKLAHEPDAAQQVFELEEMGRAEVGGELQRVADVGVAFEQPAERDARGQRVVRELDEHVGHAAEGGDHHDR